MIELHDYPIHVEWTRGKRGRATSPDGLPALAVASPPEFGGDPGVWSPEHLFVASVASCFMTTFLAIAELSKLDVMRFEVDASGRIERGEDRGYNFPEVTLRPRLVLTRERDRERAIRILAKSEEHCLVSRSIRSAIRLEATVTAEVEPEPALALA